MCVTMGPAKLVNTVIYIGEAKHEQHGLVHVLGYQNRPVSTSGPNAMILHIPSREELGPQNVIDVSDNPGFLEMMGSMSNYQNAFLLKGSGGIKPVVFDAGIYTIVLSGNANLIPEALKRVNEHKRPALNEELFAWYGKELPQYQLAVCCFDNADIQRKPNPLVWWYKPLAEEVLMAPGIDCHTGESPNLSKMVNVESLVMVGSYRIPSGIGVPVSADERWMPKEFRPFAPPRISSVLNSGFPMRNGDYVIFTSDVAGDKPTREVMKRGILQF